MAKEQLKQIPKGMGGTNEGAAVRTIKMVYPQCPEELSCQREFQGGRGWWTICEERGHDPYNTTKTQEKTVPIHTEQEDGRVLVTGSEVLSETISRPNVSQVALAERINSGLGVEIARTKKGFRFLGEQGYEDVCQFRNCHKEVKVNTVYGDYCGEQHGRLIAADVEGISLEVGDPRKRRRQLRQLDLYDRSA